MSFKSIFIKDDADNTETPVGKHPDASASETNGTCPQISASGLTSGQNAATESGDIVKKLWQVLIDKNLPGPDYLEVKNTAAALSAMNLPLDKCYEAAFRTLNASNPNFTKDVLLKSIDTYIGFIKQEQSDGKSECDRKRQIQIGEKTERSKQLLEHKEDLEKQIASLQEQVIQTESSIMKMKLEIERSTAEIDKEEEVFNASIESVVSSLNNDRKIMETLTI